MTNPIASCYSHEDACAICLDPFTSTNQSRLVSVALNDQNCILTADTILCRQRTEHIFHLRCLSEATDAYRPRDQNEETSLFWKNRRHTIRHGIRKGQSIYQPQCPSCRENISPRAFDQAIDYLNKQDTAIAKLSTQEVGLRNLDLEEREDSKIVMHAIEHNPLDLEFASEQLKDRNEIVFQALKKNPESFQFASLRIQQNQEEFFNLFDTFIKEVISKNPSILLDMPEKFQIPRALQYLKKYKTKTDFLELPLMIREQHAFALQALSLNGLYFEYLPEDLKRDQEIMLGAVTQNPIAETFFYRDYKQDKRFAQKVMIAIFNHI